MNFYRFFINFFRNIYNFIINIYNFRKSLWLFRDCDYSYNLLIFQNSLKILKESILNGNEELSSKVNKIYCINRAIILLDSFIQDDFLEKSEELLNKKFSTNIVTASHEKSHIIPVNSENSDILKTAISLEESYWEELWDIIKGTEKLGSNMRSWWT